MVLLDSPLKPYETMQKLRIVHIKPFQVCITTGNQCFSELGTIRLWVARETSWDPLKIDAGQVKHLCRGIFCNNNHTI